MAVPKSKTSKSARGQRRAHDKLKKANISIDYKTGKGYISHRICKNIYYNKLISPKKHL